MKKRKEKGQILIRITNRNNGLKTSSLAKTFLFFILIGCYVLSIYSCYLEFKHYLFYRKEGI